MTPARHMPEAKFLIRCDGKRPIENGSASAVSIATETVLTCLPIDVFRYIMGVNPFATFETAELYDLTRRNLHYSLWVSGVEWLRSPMRLRTGPLEPIRVEPGSQVELRVSWEDAASLAKFNEAAGVKVVSFTVDFVEVYE